MDIHRITKLTDPKVNVFRQKYTHRADWMKAWGEMEFGLENLANCQTQRTHKRARTAIKTATSALRRSPRIQQTVAIDVVPIAKVHRRGASKAVSHEIQTIDTVQTTTNVQRRSPRLHQQAVTTTAIKPNEIEAVPVVQTTTQVHRRSARLQRQASNLIVHESAAAKVHRKCSRLHEKASSAIKNNKNSSFISIDITNKFEKRRTSPRLMESSKSKKM